jgi:hypothetical protein
MKTQKTLFLILVSLQTVLYLAFNIVVFVQDGWLVVATAGGSSLFLLLPDALLFFWGRKIYKVDKSPVVNYGIKLVFAPIFIFLIVIVVSVLSFLISPAGVGNS